MKQEIAQKWTAALRSGKYKQGRDFLCTRNRQGKLNYCCLGVLCEVLGLEKQDEPEGIYFGKNDDVDLTELPGVAMKRSGMRTRYGGYGPGRHLSLVQDNDDKKLSFNQIAEIIDKHWEEL